MGILEDYVKKWARIVKRHPGSLLSWFDDAGGIKFGDSYIVVKVDGFSASRALYPWCSYRDFGFRALSSAISDIVSKGCKPYIYAISIGVKPNHVDFLEDILKGVEEAVNLYGGYVENMDTNAGEDDWVDVFVIGICETSPVPRTSKPLNKLVILRRIGLSSIGYIEYSEGREPLYKEVKEFTCRPKISLGIADAISRHRMCIEGSIDISDTFAETILNLSEVSGTGIYIHENPSNILHPIAVEYAKEKGLDLERMVLIANEEYTPILVVKPEYEYNLHQIFRALGMEPITIGITLTRRDITWFGKPIPKISWNYITGEIK